MKFKRCLLLLTTSALACSGPPTQNGPTQSSAKTNAGTVAYTDSAAASQPAPSTQLQQSLERLNGVITDTPSQYHHRRAEILFRLGRFDEATRDYDIAVLSELSHNEDSCWERGLAQYYAGDFRAGAEQFLRYHRVGSTDIENGLWRFLCIAEDAGLEKARDTILGYPRKSRKPFPALLALYLDEGTADAVLEEAKSGTPSAQQLTTNLFNAHYYLAKYYDIVGQKAEALTHAREALTHKITHFMYACAEIDTKLLAAEMIPESTNLIITVPIKIPMH